MNRAVNGEERNGRVRGKMIGKGQNGKGERQDR